MDIETLQKLDKMPLEKAHADDPALCEALDAAEVVMDENHKLLRKLK